MGKKKILTKGILAAGLTLGVGLFATNAFAVDCATFGGNAAGDDCTLPAGTYACQNLEVTGDLIVQDQAFIDCDGTDATSLVDACTAGSDITISVEGNMTLVNGSFVSANGGSGFSPTAASEDGTPGCVAGDVIIDVGGNMTSSGHIHTIGGSGGSGSQGISAPGFIDGGNGAAGAAGGLISITVVGAYTLTDTGHYEVEGGPGGPGGQGAVGGNGGMAAVGGMAGTVDVYSCATAVYGFVSATGGAGGPGGTAGVGGDGGNGATGGMGGVITFESGDDLDIDGSIMNAAGGNGGPGGTGFIQGAGGDGAAGGAITRNVCETGSIVGTPFATLVDGGFAGGGNPSGTLGADGTINDLATAPCCPCQVIITKTVAPDDNCDGTADGAFGENVSTGDNQCVIYEVCVENPGVQSLDGSGVLVNDDDIGITGANFGTIGSGETVCNQIPVDITALACDADQDPDCLCTEVQGMNTAYIASATCAVSQEDACTQAGSVCDDTAEVACVGCSVDIQKTVALDDNCDGTADGPFTDTAFQDTGECLLYQICVANTGDESLDTTGVTVDDAHLGLVNLNFGTIQPGDPAACIIIPVDNQSSTACNTDQDPNCECTEVQGTNTAVVSSAICDTTARSACDQPGSNCDDTADVVCLDCSVEISKNVALDDNCDGTADSAYEPSQTQDLGECLIYEICVTNTSPEIGGQNLNTDGVQVSDADLGLVDLNFGMIAPGNTVCTYISSEDTAPACDADQDPNCECTEVEGTNTAVVSSAVCAETGVNACDRPGSDCDDTATVDCLGEGCLTRTPGYWGTHPWATIQFLPVESCGIPIDNVAAMDQGSAIEDVCFGGQDTRSARYAPQQTQLIRQCTAAAINVAASTYFEGDCSSFSIPENVCVPDGDFSYCSYDGNVCETDADCPDNPFAGQNIDAVMAYCCDDLCTSDAGRSISSSGCIEAIDLFNNSEDTFDVDPDLCQFSPDDNCSAESETCRESTNNRWLNCRPGLGNNPVCL